MIREEQIEHQASEYANDSNNTIEWGDGWEDHNDFDQVFDAFKNGAKWADENPQFSKEKFIEKACEWLKEYMYVEHIFEHSEDEEPVQYVCASASDSIDEFVDRFRKAMGE